MPAGRPNKYESNMREFIKEIGILRVEGVSYKKIAKMLHIAESTLYKHKAEIDEFSEALKKSDAKLVEKLEATLYDLALGQVKTSKTKTIYNADGSIRSKEINEEILPPDRVAIFFALTNLAGDRWKHNTNIDVSSNVEASKIPSFSETFLKQMGVSSEENK